MVKLLKFEASRNIKRLTFFIVYVLFVIFIAYFSVKETQLFSGVYIRYLNSILNLGIVYFIFFSFYSYDYFSELKNVLAEEMILSIQKAQPKILFRQILINILLIFISFIPIIISIVSIIRVADFPNSKYIVHSILAVVRYIFIPALLGVGFGVILRNLS